MEINDCKKAVPKWCDILSIFASVVVCACLFQPILNREYAYAIFLIIAGVELSITIFNAFIKNKVAVGIVETAHSFTLSLIIVLFALADKSERVNYILLITALSITTAIKTFLAIYHYVKYKPTRPLYHHVYGNHNLISALTYLQALLFTIFSLIDFNGITWRIVIDLIINFIITNVVTTDAMFILVRLYTDEKLTFIGKVKFIVSTLISKDVFLYVGFFFSFMVVLFTAFNAYNGAQEVHDGYAALATFYLTLFVTRVVSHFVWKKAVKKHPENTEKTKARLSLFVSIALFVQGETIGSALIFFMQGKAQTQTPFWWFFLFLLPIALWRGVLSIMYLIRAKKTGDLRINYYGAIDLVSAGFSISGVLSMAYRYVNYNPLLLNVIYAFVIALQVLLTVVLIKLFVKSIIALAKKNKKDGSN